MGLSNAEKQAAWRARRDANLQAERDALRAEISALKEQLHNRPTEPKAATAGEDQAYLGRLAEVARLAKALADPADRRDALREERRLHNAFVRFDRALRALEQQVGAPRRDRKRAKIQALADHGATDGERRAAAETLARLDAAPPLRSATDPEPLPKTREELLARRAKQPQRAKTRPAAAE